MREQGFTLVELIIVIAVMGILLAIATMNWNQMQTKAAIEAEIKTLQTDLMDVRVKALYGKRARTVDISGQVFKSYSSAVTTVSPIETKQLRFPVVWNGGGVITFDEQGLTTDEGSLCVLPTNDITVINAAVVDSLVVSQARINLGKRIVGACTSANIEQK